ncbi:hypothetical protein PDK03_06680 [Bacillus cereus group sp. TH204-1LC]|uniref:hypothetical protein n=1 Tax=Bacillus cereus group sp. TH204-1LC TaxID=3018054 RepID=UPI0022E794A6|nr:hypothetical protein [Bacillus cereus group sp. TH204-1LC]MDA1616279.1 hypothetical protein [Bacillus cereus group sp. TH204-1LC]
MTIYQGGHNDNLGPKLYLIQNEKFLHVNGIEGVEIPMPPGVKNHEKFYTKPALRKIGDMLGDIDGFAHWGGNYLFLEFKPTTWLREYDRTQICSQIALALTTRATYWIIKWRFTVESGFEVFELIEIAPDGTLSYKEVDVAGLNQMYKDWEYKVKQEYAPDSKWNEAEKIFERILNRDFDNDDTEDGMTAIH